MLLNSWGQLLLDFAFSCFVEETGYPHPHMFKHWGGTLLLKEGVFQRLVSPCLSKQVS